jgi:hypothetical protein
MHTQHGATEHGAYAYRHTSERTGMRCAASKTPQHTRPHHQIKVCDLSRVLDNACLHAGLGYDRVAELYVCNRSLLVRGGRSRLTRACFQWASLA